MTHPQTSPAKIHVAAGKRGFGLGFGAHHQVAVYTEKGPKTGALLSDEQCAAIGEWVKTAEDRRALSYLVSPAELAGALENRLLHADTVELVRLLPKLLEKMPSADRARLFGDPVARIAPEMWEEICQTRPHLAAEGLSARNPEVYFSRLMEAGEGIKITASGEDLTFNGVSMEIAAVLLPMLFGALDEPARARAAGAIAEALQAAGEDKKFFASLADRDLNRLVITGHGDGKCDDIINNGRTIMLRSAQGPRVRFQGEEFTSRDLHFHPLKNADPSQGPVRNVEGEVDDKPEFKRYRDAAHEMQCRKTPGLDPNNDVVGQLHAIFVARGTYALLLGADVKLGAPNAEIGKYIDFLKAKRSGAPLEIIDNVGDATEVAAKSVPAQELAFDPLACFKETGKFDADNVPEAPFMSLHLGGLEAKSPDEVVLKTGKSSVFYRGVRVIHLPEPITVSREQLADLRALQPVLKAVDEETCVHPRPRFQPSRPRFLEAAAGIARAM